MITMRLIFQTRFKDNMKHGKGYQTYEDDTFYEGDWTNDQRNGKRISLHARHHLLIKLSYPQVMDNSAMFVPLPRKRSEFTQDNGRTIIQPAKGQRVTQTGVFIEEISSAEGVPVGVSLAVWQTFANFCKI